jgi:hypothetical protein
VVKLLALPANLRLKWWIMPVSDKRTSLLHLGIRKSSRDFIIPDPGACAIKSLPEWSLLARLNT